LCFVGSRVSKMLKIPQQYNTVILCTMYAQQAAWSS
jgi:hypothetical protein